MKNPDNGQDAPSDGARGAVHDEYRRRSRRNGSKRSREHTRSEPGGDQESSLRGDQPRADAAPRKRRKRKRNRKVFAPAEAQAGPSTEDAKVSPDNAAAGSGPALRSGGAAGQPVATVRAPGSGNGASRPTERSGQNAHRHGGAPPACYAALDLGTNNCRLLVAVPGRSGHFRIVDAFSRIVRLGEGLTASGRLSDAAMDRAVEALKVCAEKLSSRKLRRARLIATEACRQAANGGEFIARVKEETGLALEIIDRKTEARLAVSGCGSLVERDAKGVVLFDIGGGSSEIALIDVSRHRTPRLANHIVSWTSLPVGVVTLAEKFGGKHVTPAVFEAMIDHVGELLETFEERDRLSHVAADEGFHLLGTSGTVTTLAGIHLGLERYDRRRVDGLWLTAAEVDAMIARLVGWPFDRRVANPCIGVDRADLVLGGCAILEAIRRLWPSERLRVADRGLREGMLSELMADDGVWRRARRRRFPAS